MRVRCALTALLSLAAIASSASGAAALTLKLPLPLLGGSSEGSKPLEVSLPPITVSLPPVSVTTPSVGVSVEPTPTVTTPTVTTPTVTTPTVSTPSLPGTPSTPSPPSVAPVTGAPVSSTPVARGASAGATSVQSSSGSNPSTTSGQAVAGARRSARSVRRSAASSRHRGGSSSASTTAAVPAGLVASAPGKAGKHASSVMPKHLQQGASSPLTAIGKALPLPLPVPDWSKPIILALLLLAGFFALRSRLSARRAGRLELRSESLQRDLGVVQAALVPDVPPTIGGLGVSVAYEPADGPAAGGDFYDVFLAEAGKLVMILGDVSGHGHEAVSHAALTRYTLRAYMQAGLEPRAALALAGRVMADPTCEQFATVAVAVYREREGTLTYASAGHPGPILLGSSAKTHSEACCSPPIGWSAPTGRRQSTVSLPAGALVCFFTDGLIEARGEQDLLLGRERVEELFDRLGPRPAAGEFLASVRAAALATPDDMAACVLHAHASGNAPPVHVEELEVDSKRLQGEAVERFMADFRVSGQVSARVLARARVLADERRSALIRVSVGEEGSSATVTAAPGLTAPEGVAPELIEAPPQAAPLSIA